jgi:predicted nucleic acid-binding protein
MRIQLDTNILLRMNDEDHVSHGEAKLAVDTLNHDGHECVIVPQVLYEYWVVAARPLENNGLGVDVATAETDVTEWTTIFRLLLDERGVFARWRDLVATREVKGKTAHDARLVAAMQRHGLTQLLTFNKPDFARFTSIQVFTPTEIIAGQLPA